MKTQITQNPFQSKLIKVTRFSDIESLDPSTLVISDLLFKSSLNSHFKSKKIPAYFIQSGEKIKSIERFPFHLKKIHQIIDKQDIKSVVALGGGSIGDFAGFFASIYKRGVDFIQIPSTWLAALDSAHGGKTALNGFDSKNQYGTFYPASKVYLCKEFLIQQPQQRAVEAFGELYKIALISGHSLWKKISSLKDLDNELLWKFLEPAIIEKYKIVLKDPFEKKEIRQILNLGHTLGHAFEVKYKIHHGIAVSYGLNFCLEYSFKKGFMTEKTLTQIKKTSIYPFFVKIFSDLQPKPFEANQLRKLLYRDKKRTHLQKINFVFLKKPGQPVVQSMSIDEIIEEFNRQKKTRLSHSLEISR